MSSRVLITRAPERSDELIRLLRAEGVEALSLEATRIVSVAEIDKLPDLHEFRWIAFTSVNGVKHFADILRRARRELPPNIKIAVIGAGTSSVARSLLRAPDLAAQRPLGEGLAETMLMAENPERLGRVLWPCSAQAMPTFANQMANADVHVTAYQVYDTIAVPPDELRFLANKWWPWHVAMFAAPSAVNAFKAAWGTPWKFGCVAIGPTTARALRDIGVSEVTVSSGPTPQALAEAIVRRLAKGIAETESLSNDQQSTY